MKQASPARPVAQTRDDASRRRIRRRALVRWLRRGLLALAALAVLVYIVRGLLPQPVPVDTAVVERAPLREIISADGMTRVEDRYVVSAPVAGRVLRLDLDPGDQVAAGAVIARVVPAAAPLLDVRSEAEAQARLQSARAGLAQAEAELARARAAAAAAQRDAQRYRPLRGTGAVSEESIDRVLFEAEARAEEVEAARQAVAVARGEVAAARAVLGRLRGGEARDRAGVPVRAPIAGVVLRVLQESEAVVAAGTPLIEIGDPDELEAVVDVLSSEAVRIEIGDAVVLRGWGGDHSLPGKVSEIEPSAFTRISALGIEEQRVNVVIALDEASRLRLGDGYRVDADIVVWQGEGVLAVPLGSLFRQGERWAVYVVKDGRAELRAIDIGHRSQDRVEVTRGLDEGTSIVLQPSDRVGPGVKVAVRAR